MICYAASFTRAALLGLLRSAGLAALPLLALAALTVPAAHAQTTYIGLDDPRGPSNFNTPNGTFPNSLAARANFLAALTVSGTNDIESFAYNTQNPTLTFGTTGVTATTDTGFVARFTNIAPTSGTKYIGDQFGIDDSFTFSTPITAFGLNIIGAGNIAAPSIVTLRLQNTGTGTSKDVSYTLNNLTTVDNVLFFGVTDTAAFNKVFYINSQEMAPPFGDSVAFDDITVGTLAPVAAVTAPDPNSIALLLVVGVPAVGLVRRRKSDINKSDC